MEGVPCGHPEAVEIGETEEFDTNDDYRQWEICLCPDCGDDFLFPLAA